MRLSERFSSWIKRFSSPADVEDEGPNTHIVMLDGTMSSLTPGSETNVGQMYRLLEGCGDLCVYYEPGIQWRGWQRSFEVMAGVGINRQIKRAYHWLATHYQPGDHIYFVGYSRGAYAVRALAGLIDRIGLLRDEFATPAKVDRAYDHYMNDATSPEARLFAAHTCHPKVSINAVACFDTVQAIGLRWPLVWRFVPDVHVFRDAMPASITKRGFHALAYDETRMAYAPKLWDVPEHKTGDFEQRWFKGTHGDIGGQLGGFNAARPLSNMSLTWVLEALEADGLAVPAGWRDRFPTDASAPSAGNWRGFGFLFLWRKRRKTGQEATETFDASLTNAAALVSLQATKGGSQPAAR